MDLLLTAAISKLGTTIQGYGIEQAGLVGTSSGSVKGILTRVRETEKEVKKLEMSSVRGRDLLSPDVDDLQLKDMKDALYDIEAVLDEWNAAVERHRARAAEGADGCCAGGALLIVKGLLSIPFPCCDERRRSEAAAFVYSKCPCLPEGFHLWLRYDSAGRIKDVNSILDNNQKRMLNATASSAPAPVNVMGSGSSSNFDPRTTNITENVGDEVKGRRSEAADVVSMLLEDGTGLRTVCVTGMGGIGKTTLARLIYHDDRVKNHFGPNIHWLHVTSPFNQELTARNVLEVLSQGAANSFHLLIPEVHRQIRYVAAQKRFLLVLDDVWEDKDESDETENRTKWSDLTKDFECAHPGSRILMTTRGGITGKTLGFKDARHYELRELQAEHCWSIFKGSTSNNWSGSDGADMEELETIIEGACDGLPFIAADLMARLHESSTQGAIDVLGSRVWAAYKDDHRRFRHLKLSYDRLKLLERRCLSFCGSLRHKTWLDKQQLLDLWMADGCVGVPLSIYTTSDRQPIDLADKFFKVLSNGCFFQVMNETDPLALSTRAKFRIHRLVRDFAQLVGQYRSLYFDTTDSNSILNDESIINARHLRLLIGREGLKPLNFELIKKLRSLVVEVRDDAKPVTLDGNGLSRLFMYATWLRSLGLSKCGIEEIPATVNKLIHLRWLDLTKNNHLTELPEGICELYYLETLCVDWCSNLARLPRSMSQLVHLKHFRNYGTRALVTKQVVQLPHLVTLSMFRIGGDELTDEMATLGDLMECADRLQGFLCITGLKHVRSSRELTAFKLEEFKQIQTVELVFDEDTNPAAAAAPGDAAGNTTRATHETEVLQALKPPRRITGLTIEGYYGSSAPEWMNLSYALKTITLSRCPNWVELPALGSLINLEVLKLKYMHSMTAVRSNVLGLSSPSAVAFPKLTHLWFDSIERWVEWSEDVQGGNIADERIMPLLQVLRISSCDNLRGIPQRLIRMREASRLSIQGWPPHVASQSSTPPV